jgi:hypothetical protein
MHRIHRVRIVFAVLLLTTWLPAWGVQPRSREEARPTRLAALARSAAALVWSQLAGLRVKAGCIIDPHGVCATRQSTTETDEGCGIDPHGGCAAGR